MYILTKITKKIFKKQNIKMMSKVRSTKIQGKVEFVLPVNKNKVKGKNI